MKKESYRIKIKNPCHQDWERMPKVEKGFFCSQCTKVVIDFGNFSDEDLIRALSNKQTEICGKFNRSQLAKVYQIGDQPSQGPMKAIKLLLAGFLSLQLPTGAQTAERHKPEVIKVDLKQTDSTKKSHTLTIKGKVFERGKNVFLKASVKLYANRSDEHILATVLTDEYGRYELQLPDKGLSKFFKIVFTSENHEERTVVVDKDRVPLFLPVSLQVLIKSEEVAYDLYLDEHQTAGIEPYLEIERVRITAGVAPFFEINEVSLGKRLWFRVKLAFRKTFKKNK